MGATKRDRVYYKAWQVFLSMAIIKIEINLEIICQNTSVENCLVVYDTRLSFWNTLIEIWTIYLV